MRIGPLFCCAWLAGCGASPDGEPAAAGLSLVTTPLRDLVGPSVPVVGAAVAAGPLRTEPVYAATLATNYNQVTPVVALKWEVLRPSATVFDFTDADAIVAAAETAGQSVRGHTLVWEVNLPSWFTALTGNAVRTAMLAHIDTVVSRYQGRIAHWDVVNEPLTSGGTYRNNLFLQAMGSGYLAEAFRAANLADPSARLAYNDFGIESPGAKQDGAYTMVRNLRTAGVPIHEVGIQLHARPAEWVAGTMTAATLQSAIRRFGSLGVDVYITELDLPLTALTGSTELRLDIQRRIAHNITAACYAEPACKGVTTWGFTDRYTGQGAAAMPLPFDVDYVAKPFYDGLARALLGEPAPSVNPPPPSVCTTLTSALFCDPMESETFANMSRVLVAGGQVTSTTTAYRGTRAARASTPLAAATRRAYLERRITPTGSELWTSARVLVPPSGPNNFTVLAMDEPLSPYHGVSLGLHTDGRLFLRVGGATVVRAYGGAWPRGQWACVELRIQAAASGGRADAYVNGTLAASVANVKTLFASGYGTVKGGIIWAPADGAAVDVSLDELVVSATRPGCN